MSEGSKIYKCFFPKFPWKWNVYWLVLDPQYLQILIKYARSLVCLTHKLSLHQALVDPGVVIRVPKACSAPALGDQLPDGPSS